MASRLRHGCHTRGAIVLSTVLTVAGTVRAQTPAAPYPGSGATYPSGAQPPLHTGGLRPPPSAPQSPGQTQTLQRLERAEREDAGRGLEFVWINVDAGYEYVALHAFDDGGLVDGELARDSGSALALGAAAGVRLIFATLGARFRVARTSDYDLWTLGAEAGLHFPFGALEPSLTLGAGYASLGGLELEGVRAERASGLDVRVGAALDWYINPLLSIGALGSFELLVLGRDGTGAAPSGGAGDVYARDGDAIGLAASLSAVAGLHF